MTKLEKKYIMHSLALNKDDEGKLTYLEARGFKLTGIFREGLTYLYEVLKKGERPYGKTTLK